MTSNYPPPVHTSTPCDTGQCKYGTMPVENFPTLGSLVDPSTVALQIESPSLLARGSAIEERSILIRGALKGMAQRHPTPFLLDTETGMHGCTLATRLPYGTEFSFFVMGLEAQIPSVAFWGREVMNHEEIWTNPGSSYPGSHFVTRTTYRS